MPIPTNLADVLDRGRERIAANPVTGSELEKMWRHATKRGPRPDLAHCEVLAAYISRLMPAYLRQIPVRLNPEVALPADLAFTLDKRRRMREAIRVLHKGINECRPALLDDVVAAAELDLFVAWLDRMEGRLCSKMTDQGYRAWHVVGYAVCEQAQITREALGVRADTVSRAGVVANFTSLVLRHLGFGEVKAATIADHHAAVKARLAPPGSLEWLEANGYHPTSKPAAKRKAPK